MIWSGDILEYRDSEWEVLGLNGREVFRCRDLETQEILLIRSSDEPKVKRKNHTRKRFREVLCNGEFYETGKSGEVVIHSGDRAVIDILLGDQLLETVILKGVNGCERAANFYKTHTVCNFGAMDDAAVAFLVGLKGNRMLCDEVYIVVDDHELSLARLFNLGCARYAGAE